MLGSHQGADVAAGPWTMESRRLPVEVITYILSFLPLADRKEASLVSRTWYFAARDSLRQESILYNIPAASASLPAIESLARWPVSCVRLASLDSSAVSRDVVQTVSSHLGPHLRSVSLRGSSLSESSFVHLLLACPHLSSLDLSGCNSLFMAGTLLSQPETLRQAQRTLTHLQELDLAGLRHLSDLSFNRLTSCTPCLARLSLARCHLAFEWDPSRGAHSSPALLSFRNLLRFLKEQAGSLRALDLSGTGLTSPALGSLVRVEGLRLRELVLQHCGDLSDEAVGLLCTHQPHLTALDLTGCAELRDRAVLALSTGLLALRSLRLGKLPRLTDGAFLHVAELRSLQSLDVAECSRVSGRELMKACSSPERQPPLVSLSFAFCSLLADSSVLSLARSLSGSLQALDLSSCISITDASLRAVSSHLPRLTLLRLAWCKELTDGGLLGVEVPREVSAPKGPACNGPGVGSSLPQRSRWEAQSHWLSTVDWQREAGRKGSGSFGNRILPAASAEPGAGAHGLQRLHLDPGPAAAPGLPGGATAAAGAGPHGLQQANRRQHHPGHLLPGPEAPVPRLAARAHRRQPGGRGRGLPQPGAAVHESLREPDGRWLRGGRQLSPEAPGPRPRWLQPAHGPDPGSPRQGVQAAQEPGRVHVPRDQHGRHRVLPGPQSPAAQRPVALCGGSRPFLHPVSARQRPGPSSPTGPVLAPRALAGHPLLGLRQAFSFSTGGTEGCFCAPSWPQRASIPH